MPALVKALKRVDLPTLGRPTMPHWRLMAGAFRNLGVTGYFRRPASAEPRLAEAQAGPDRLADAQRVLHALQHDGVHAEGDGAADPRIRAVAAQCVAHLGA